MKIQNITSHLLRSLMVVAMMVCGVGESWGQTNANYVPYEFYTDVNQLKNGFAIVNADEGKALYGSNYQNVAYADYATAFATTNAVTMFKVDGNQTNGGYLLRAITPAGSENYSLWGSNPCYFNAQPEIGGVTFILGLNNQNGQDMENGAVWKLNYVAGSGWTMQCVGNNGYAAPNNVTQNDPYYWQFCSLADGSSSSSSYVIYTGSNYLNSSTSGTTTFNPSSCLWTGTSGSTFQNGESYYLRRNNNSNGSFSVTMSNSANCTLSGTESGTTGQKIKVGTNNNGYLRFANNAWSTNNSGGNVVFAVTKKVYASSSTFPTISGDDTFEATESKTYSHTNASYIPAYYDYVFYNGAHHYCTSTTSNATTTAPTTETFTYTWSLLNEDGTAYTGSNVTQTNGVVKYQTLFGTDTNMILRLTAKSTSKTFNVDKLITFKSKTTCTTPIITFNNATKQVSITGQAGETIHYTTDNGYYGDEPTGTSPVYSSPISITQRTRIRAIATKTGSYDSNIASMIVDNPYNVVPSTNQSINLVAGNSYDISYTLNGPTAGEVIYDNVEYSMEDASIATVDQNGHIEAIKRGTTNVILQGYKLDGTKLDVVKVQVTVKNPQNDPNGLGVNAENKQINLGETWQIEATAYGESPVFQGFTYTITGTEGIVSISNTGLVTPIKKGTTIVTVTALNYDGTPSAYSKNINIEVVQAEYIDGKKCITSLSEITDMNGKYILTGDIDASGYDTEITDFSGVLDGNFKTISGLSRALFASINGGTVKNVILDNVQIKSGTNVGAIANEASGSTRIYNCGVLAKDGESTISGTQNVGGIVGLVTGNTRVINCYSFANIAGGNYKGGIVGRNVSTATTQSNVDSQAMVMNCMFYGDIATGGAQVAPIFAGNNISNAGSTGLNTFNYFRYESPYCINGKITTYNCALAAEERYLTRFEFYRLQLNSNKELAAWYATGSTANGAQMAKWVLDKSIAPYPILKSQDKYPSIINIDAANAVAKTERNKGGLLGTLTVSISQDSNAPQGANITTSSLTLNITDKDEDNYNYNYRKVQLPYYNEVGTGNYTNNKVVTGWKVTVAGTSKFTTGSDAPAYNFADPTDVGKDNNGTSGRVFAQGAYFNVPDGVTSISIQPYWGNAVYLSDPNYDLVYSTSYSATNVATMGTRYTNGNSYTINGSSQKVYTSMDNAFTNLPTGTSVYDNAIVLVGNYHQYANTTEVFNKSKPVTIMSADLDMDNEPDYSYLFQSTNRIKCCPIRFDFLNWPGIGMMQKVTGTTQMPNQGILHPLAWFEVTGTCIARFTEFEWDQDKTTSAPLILLGGIYEQITSTWKNQSPTHTPYIILGDNAWFKEFQNGTHADGNYCSPHMPISVTGGEYLKFYLSGTFNPNASTTPITDNAECYINGGKFGELAGAGQEQIMGDVIFLIDNADIDEFYGGGTNDKKPITGKINTTINNSYVTKFCGGPKFGNMADKMTVTTTANGTTFGTYYGAGNGGTSYYRYRTRNSSGAASYDWNTWATTDFTRGKYNSNYGIQANYEYEYFAWAGGSTTANVGRLYVNYASLSLAQTNDVTSTLTNCTILNDFYGGGNLGKVSGDATSTLTNCTVGGSAFAAGFSAAVPTVTVFDNSNFQTEPSYNGNVGVYNQGVYPTSTDYYWSNNGNTTTPLNTVDGVNCIYTNKSLSDLGVVSGKAEITIDGGSVAGSVYGGGNESNSEGNTVVNIDGGTVSGGVYGGGALANVTGNTKVNLNGGTVNDVYGGGLGQIESGTVGQADYKAAIAASVGSTTVNIGSGTVASIDEDATNVAGSCTINGSVFGCNNLNGSPTGDATVNVFRTYNANPTDASSYNAKIASVYGGGNLAAYIPANTALTSTTGTHVNIYTCKNQIDYVYGGGNAASAPATNVNIWGGKFDWVFGGGNGKTEEGQPTNPGANVGYYTDTDINDVTSHGAAYGTGVANTSIHDGVINHLFGGSNTRGNIRYAAISQLEHAGCDFTIGEVYAAGNEAYMDGTAILNIGCIPGLGVLYGGARKADINNDVQLTITSGTYGQVFGGNNESGNVNGSITINIEETGCNPIVLGEVYGGGNLAPYTVPAGKNGPTINAYSFTQIGKIYGGGYGETAIVTGDTHVNVQQLKGIHAGTTHETYGNVPDAMGIIGNIFGGGNAAKVVGNTFVNIGTVRQVEFKSVDTDKTKDVLGANIQPITVTIPKNITGGSAQTYTGDGNVFGGGNNAEVTGKTNVVIGADKQ